MADSKEEGYLDFSNVETGNGKVITPGEYTITIDNSDSKPVFVFTPAADLKPAELPEKFVKGGCYLVGKGFAANDYKLDVNTYIDPDNGLKLTLPKGAKVQVVGCKSATMGGEDWIYQKNSYFAVVDGASYIDFKGGYEGTVVTGGEYTVTVSGEGDARVFPFTHAEGLEPDTSVTVYDYYIKGNMNNPGGSWEVGDKFVVDQENEGVYKMTIQLAAGVEFGFLSAAEGTTDQIDWFGSGLTLTGDTEAVTKGGNLKTVSAGTYTFTLDPANNTLAVSFTPASTPDPGPEQPGPGTETENPAE